MAWLAATSSAVGAAGPLILDDAPQPFAPQRPRTEVQRDRLEAAALFAAGRMHQRREEYAAALRCYQRAWRYDSQSLSIVRAIVPAAVKSQRYAEAVRYALKAADLESADPAMLRGLGGFLAEEGDWARAAALYEKVLAAQEKKQAKASASDVLLRMELGRIYCLLDKPRPAAECFAQVLKAVDRPAKFGLDESLVKVLLGRQGPTYQLIGECFLDADRPQEARAAFEKAEQVAPEKALNLFNLARLETKTGQPAKALASLEAALAAGLGNEGQTPYETLAAVLESLGKKGELLDRLEKLRAAEPGNLPLRYYLAGQYAAAGKLDRAESLYAALLREKPSREACRGLIQVYRRQKRFDSLLTTLGEAMDSLGVLDVIAAEEQTVSGDAAALSGLVEAARGRLKSAPEKLSGGMRLAVAVLALEAKQYETASEFFELALAAKTPRAAEALMAWGVGLLMGERAGDAARVFQRAVDQKALPDDNPAFYFYLAGALAVDQRTDEALAAARTAAEQKKDSARYCGREAWALYVGHRNDEARRSYEELIRRFDADYASPENRDVLREARLALSNLALLAGDPALAEEWLEQVLDEFPDDVGALNDLGYLWTDRNKNLSRAQSMIERAVAAEPDNVAYRDSLGWVLFRRGQFAQAVVELQKAVAGAKPDGVVLDHLGDAYDRLNRRDQAVEAWRKAAETLRREKETEKAAAVEKKLKTKN